jgi:predicted nucleic acid-binding protein
MGFVLDSSVTLAWLMPDEDAHRVDALADRLEQESAEVPAIWSLEVGNALISALRRARIEDAVIASSLCALATLPINPDRAIGAGELPAILAIASQHGLTTYDACYLELAERKHLPLATLDRKLREACDAMGVAVLP